MIKNFLNSTVALLVTIALVTIASEPPAAADLPTQPAVGADITIGDLASDVWPKITGQAWSPANWEIVVPGNAKDQGVAIGITPTGIPVHFDIRGSLDIPILFEELLPAQQDYVLENGVEPWTGLAIASGPAGTVGVDISGFYEAASNTTRIYIIAELPLCAVSEKFCDFGADFLDAIDPFLLNEINQVLSADDVPGFEPATDCERLAEKFAKCEEDYADSIAEIAERLQEALQNLADRVMEAELAAADELEEAKEQFKEDVRKAEQKHAKAIKAAVDAHKEASGIAFAIYIATLAAAKNASTFALLIPTPATLIAAGAALAGTVLLGLVVYTLTLKHLETALKNSIQQAHNDLERDLSDALFRFETRRNAILDRLKALKDVLFQIFCNAACALNERQRRALQELMQCLEDAYNQLGGDCVLTVDVALREIFDLPDGLLIPIQDFIIPDDPFGCGCP